jgi:hypothetical protein
MESLAAPVSADSYLREILARESIDSGIRSPLRALEADVLGLCRDFCGSDLLEVHPTGAFEKGTANASGVSIDFLASFSPASPVPVHDLYEALFDGLQSEGLEPVRRDVSVALMLDGIAVDIVPGKREAMITDVHEIWLTRLGRPVKTNLTQHVLDAVACGRRDEIRVLKIWRDQHGLDLPSFYLERSAVAALRQQPLGTLAENVWAALGYLEKLFPARSILDPANANNIVSDQLGSPAKDTVRKAAQYARSGRAWAEIIR